MTAEVGGGALFGSMALIADGLHMSTHAGALLIAALAYAYARQHAHDQRFVFGTGKLGDLAAFTSAIILVMIALLIAWESLGRLLYPLPIAFDQAIPVAVLGLCVNVASAWLLSSTPKVVITMKATGIMSIVTMIPQPDMAIVTTAT